MAYSAKNLSALGYANGFTLWHYRTEDMAKVVASPSYFAGAARMIRVGDFVLVNAETKDRVLNFTLAIVGIGKDIDGNPVVDTAPLDKVPL